MMEEYYIPDISEFKQGFVYEQLIHIKGEIIGSWGVGKERYAAEDFWMEKEVWWDRKPQMKVVPIDDVGNTLAWMEDPTFDNWPSKEQIQKLIDDGRIRAKI